MLYPPATLFCALTVVEGSAAAAGVRCCSSIRTLATRTVGSETSPNATEACPFAPMAGSGFAAFGTPTAALDADDLLWVLFPADTRATIPATTAAAEPTATTIRHDCSRRTRRRRCAAELVGLGTERDLGEAELERRVERRPLREEGAGAGERIATPGDPGDRVECRAGRLRREAQLDGGAIELAVELGAQQLVEGFGVEGSFGCAHGAREVGCSEGGDWFPSASRSPR